jgi:pimeloyl-ACP methyl ester carboxylesterase
MTPELLYFDIPGTDTVPSHRLACTQWGSVNASRTVFCVHGLSRNGRDFDFLAEALAKDFRVLCPDMAGRGQSTRLTNPANYNYATYVADCKFLLDTLKIPRVHWVGTSMGGIVGMMMGSLFPGLLQSLVLNDVGALIPAAGLKRIFSYAGAKTSFASRAEAEATLRKNCATFGITGENQWQHLFDTSIQEKNGVVSLACDPAISASFPKPEEVQDVDLWKFWEPLKQIPVLVIRGANSDILTRPTAQGMKANHPRLTLLEVEGAGHAPALMDEKQIAFIQKWLGSE